MAISTIGTNSLSSTGVTPGTYGSGSSIPSLTIDAAGRVTAASSVAGGGKVLQVVNTYYTTPGSVGLSSTYNVYTDVTGITASITPSSTNSKILIFVRWFGEFSDQTPTWNTMWNIKRNGTVIGQPPQPGSLNIGIHMSALSYYANDGDSTPETVFFNYYDSPSSTSSVTYQACVSSTSGGTMYINRCVNSSTSGGYERGTSSMILMEIAA